MKKAFFSGLIFTAALALASIAPAQAAPITYNLSNVVFNDGATATGSFIYETAEEAITSFSFTTAFGTASSYTYDAVSSVLLNYGGNATNFFVFIENTGSRYITLGFESATLAQGGTHALDSSLSTELTPSGMRNVISGDVIGTFADVPEPSTPMLALAAVGALALVRRKTAGKTD